MHLHGVHEADCAPGGRKHALADQRRECSRQFHAQAAPGGVVARARLREMGQHPDLLLGQIRARDGGVDEEGIALDQIGAHLRVQSHRLRGLLDQSAQAPDLPDGKVEAEGPVVTPAAKAPHHQVRTSSGCDRVTPARAG